MLRRPRPIRLKTSMRIFVTVYIIVSGSVGFAILSPPKKAARNRASAALPNLIPLAMFVLIWSILTATMFRAIVRDRSLLSDGEIAIERLHRSRSQAARIAKAKSPTNSKTQPAVPFSGKCTDRTRKLFEEMPVPVFYDPANPSKNVALAGATYDLIES